MATTTHHHCVDCEEERHNGYVRAELNKCFDCDAKVDDVTAKRHICVDRMWVAIKHANRSEPVEFTHTSCTTCFTHGLGSLGIADEDIDRIMLLDMSLDTVKDIVTAVTNSGVDCGYYLLGQVETRKHTPGRGRSSSPAVFTHYTVYNNPYHGVMADGRCRRLGGSDDVESRYIVELNDVKGCIRHRVRVDGDLKYVTIGEELSSSTCMIPASLSKILLENMEMKRFTTRVEMQSSDTCVAIVAEYGGMCIVCRRTPCGYVEIYYQYVTDDPNNWKPITANMKYLKISHKPYHADTEIPELCTAITTWTTDHGAAVENIKCAKAKTAAKRKEKRARRKQRDLELKALLKIRHDEEEANEKLCVVCMDAGRDITFSCGHTICCGECAAMLTHCPFDRSSL
jgi:hypothetical protein